MNGVTVKVISKEHVVQQVSKTIDKDMTHEMSDSILVSDSAADPGIYGFFCCPACYNDHTCGELDPVDYL